MQVIGLTGPPVFFRQLKSIGDNFSYIIADGPTRDAAVIDPSGNGEEIAALLSRNDLRLKYIVVTHHHHDHLGDSYSLRSLRGGQIVVHESSGVDRDLPVADGDVLELGQVQLRVIHTPGHTPDSISILADGRLFTGDTLFIGECGRTDLAEGDPSKMYDSLFHKIGSLPDDTVIYPGHDYGPKPWSTLGEQKRTNYTLKERTLEEFIMFMAEP
ncbi:MAG TPA: MBL fold metallo-hydrolase [Conexivisphaerales archaeon]|nr:MBL fold metallo-hydrolase [Conexivisphaerales archaeon]